MSIKYTYTQSNPHAPVDNNFYQMTEQEFKIQKILGLLNSTCVFRFCPHCNKKTPAEQGTSYGTSIAFPDGSCPIRTDCYRCKACNQWYNHHIYSPREKTGDSD